MIEESLFKLDEDPKIRAQGLAKAAESQTRAGAVYPSGLREEERRWCIGSLQFWKSEAFKQLHDDTAPFPSYRRGSLEWALMPDMHFELEPFVTTEGERAIAIVLRSEKDPFGAFGTFSLDENEANRIIDLLNREMDATRAMATERFRASGGDPAVYASARAPSPAEMFAILDGLFGDPDEEYEGGADDASRTAPRKG